ncbi:sensor histidine kinase [Foetidibacter luteolus]|uniref:sensor histidine kinase n=1 Tax=Foetidibacter luteolus TaxID=2608880 RepID=UPI001A99AB54|nr:HAMP domain-containing sensor histidine kinase [Foetidibacter luteolus]
MFSILPDSLHPRGDAVTPAEICKIIFNTQYTNKYNQALLDSLTYLAKKYAVASNETAEKVNLYRAIVKYYYQTIVDSDSILLYTDKLIAQLEKDTALKRLHYAEALVAKGTAYSYKEKFEDAITTYQQGLDYIEKYPGQVINKSRLLGVMGEMYMNLNNYALCIEYTKKSQALKAHLVDSLWLRNVYSFNCNATASYINEFYVTGNKALLDSAANTLEEGYRAQRPRDTIVFYSTYNLLSSKIAYARQDYAAAKKHIDLSNSPKALSNDIYAGYIKDERTAMTALVLFKTGNENKALQLIKQELNELKPLANNTFFELYLNEMYSYYKKKKDYANATLYLEKLIAYTNERKILDNRGVVYEAEKKYNSEKINSQLLQTQLAVTRQKQKLGTTVYAAVCIFVLLFSISMVFYYRNKKNRLLAAENAKHAEIVKEKNEELQQQIEQLEDYQGKLEQDYQLKNRLISIIGHDIITPLKFLNRVAGTLFKRQQQMSRAEVDETLQLIMDSSGNLHSMASNMLKWIKHHDKNMQFIAAAFELKDLVKSVLANAAPMAETKKLPLVNKVPENTVLVQYQELLQTLLVQLVTNSIKYSERGLIQVRAEVTEKVVALTVTDEGIGIPESMIQDLLQSNRNVVSETHELKGQGFGFLIIKDMLKIMQGNISISSRLNEGTSITISIPINITQAA